MSDSAYTILIAEDDDSIRHALTDVLTASGYEVLALEEGLAAIHAVRERNFDLALLDVAMPGADGFQVLQAMSEERPGTPVIMLTARGEEEDRVQGLKRGADDYIVKPFEMKEVLARIHAVLRRRPAKDQPGAPSKENIVVRFGDFELDLGRRELRKNGELIALTTGEFAVMKAFARHPKVPLSRDKLMEMARGREYEAFDRSLDVQVSRLRKLIEPDPAKPRYLQTVWGLGYVFIPDDTASGKDGVKPETK